MLILCERLCCQGTRDRRWWEILQTEMSPVGFVRMGASLSQGNNAEEFREELGLLHRFDVDGQLFSGRSAIEGTAPAFGYLGTSR